MSIDHWGTNPGDLLESALAAIAAETGPRCESGWHRVNGSDLAGLPFAGA